jgi:hypothetical protein
MEYESELKTVLLPVSGYEQPSIQSFVVYRTAKIFVGFEKRPPWFDQHFPAKFSVFPLVFRAEHHQSLEIALANVG